MLRVQALINKGEAGLKAVPYDYFETETDEKYLTFHCKGNHNLKNGDRGKLVSSKRLYDYENNQSHECNFSENVTIIVEDDKPTEFKIERSTEMPLQVKRTHVTPESAYVIYFTSPHGFNKGESGTLIMYYQDNGLDIQRMEITVTYDTYTSVLYNGNLPMVYDLYRKDFRFEDADSLTVYSAAGYYNISLPLGQLFATNANQEDLVQKHFVEEETEKAIPPIVDMEKFVYTPIIKKGDEELEVNEIIFNFHFREREGEDWLVKDEGYWNGYPEGEKNDIIVTFDEPEKQSDLLTFLSFVNQDVRYQKSRLKKSFIRLSFYDSNNQANQNLLFYSTVFLETGVLFGKMCKYYDDIYHQPVYNEETGEIEPDPKERVGIRVDSEPYSFMKSDGDVVYLSDKDDDFKEKRRLSTRMTVKDRFNSEGSSDGFYVYLFQADDPNLRHKDMYMRVDFNHAGFGRSLPFMRPTDFDMDTLENGRAKDFQTIIDDCKPKDGEKAGGYDLETYYTHLYVQFKYGYSKKLQKHVYYLAYAAENGDDYMTFDDENRRIIFNLYEAKVH